MWILTLACSVLLGWMTLYVASFLFHPSLPASLPFFSQSFGCKTASRFVEFLCRINICNCKALAGSSLFQGKGGGDGEHGLGCGQAQHPGSTKAYREHLM